MKNNNFVWTAANKTENLQSQLRTIFVQVFQQVVQLINFSIVKLILELKYHVFIHTYNYIQSNRPWKYLTISKLPLIYYTTSMYKLTGIERSVLPVRWSLPYIMHVIVILFWICERWTHLNRVAKADMVNATVFIDCLTSLVPFSGRQVVCFILIL